MIRRLSSTTPALKSPAAEAGLQPERSAVSATSSVNDAEWERSLFLQPARLAEARRHEAARSQRWSGLLLAGLAALAVGVGDVRAEDDLASQGKESSTAFDYWAWLTSWFGEPAQDETTAQQKNDEGTTDPTEGN